MSWPLADDASGPHHTPGSGLPPIIKPPSYSNPVEYDAKDTIRFYALRMHDVGFIKSSPQKISAEGTDWRFLNELKRELKA